MVKLCFSPSLPPQIQRTEQHEAMRDSSTSRNSITLKPPKPLPAASSGTSSTFGETAILPRGSHHRRAHSEANFRLPDNLNLVSSDPYDAPADEMGSEDDLFSTYMNIDGFDGGLRIHNGDDAEGKDGRIFRHRHSSSVDGSNSVDCIEAKKAMAPDKLAELWNIDPKRAKRIMANRQSAARSKERKARYISELEKKVQTLQTEATTLSAQLALFQRDTMGLTTENSELKNRLLTLEQQAHLQDAMNETLKKEVERLKRATGETSSPSEIHNLEMHHVLYNHSLISLPQHHTASSDSQNIHITQFQQLQSSMAAHHLAYGAAQSHGFLAMSRKDPLSRLQGLDINGRGSTSVKTERPSLSASEGSS